MTRVPHSNLILSNFWVARAFTRLIIFPFLRSISSFITAQQGPINTDEREHAFTLHDMSHDLWSGLRVQIVVGSMCTVHFPFALCCAHYRSHGHGTCLVHGKVSTTLCQVFGWNYTGSLSVKIASLAVPGYRNAPDRITLLNKIHCRNRNCFCTLILKALCSHFAFANLLLKDPWIS